MVKIYTKGNYFFVKFEGKTEPLSDVKSNVVVVYLKETDNVYLVKSPYIGTHEIKLSNIIDENDISFDLLSWESFYLSNTGFNTALGGSSATSRLYKYTVDTFNDLSTITDAVEGDIARVYNSQGIWGINKKSEGAYTYLSGVWEYGSRSLQVEILNNDADILALQNEQITQNQNINNRLLKFDRTYVIRTLSDFLEIHPANASKEIILGNNVYVIDSSFLDLEEYKLVSFVDTAIHGFSQAINSLGSTFSNTTVINSSGNLFLYQIALKAEGTNSKCIVMNGASGFESLDMKYVEFRGSSKYGSLSNIRQGYWSDGFSFGAREGFDLSGNFVGGFSLFNTRIINTTGYLLKGNAGFTCNNIRSNVNVTVPTGSFAFDFDFNHFNGDEAYQLKSCAIDGGGEMCRPFTLAGGADTTIPENSKKSFFQNNSGSKAKNTHPASYWRLTTETPTTFTAINTYVKLAGTTTYDYLVHFRQSASNAPIYNTVNEKAHSLAGNIIIRGTQGNVVTLQVRVINNTTNAFTVVHTTAPRAINNNLGSDDFTNFTIETLFKLKENERIEIWGSKLATLNPITMALGSTERIVQL